jgi:hypothetical protein
MASIQNRRFGRFDMLASLPLRQLHPATKQTWYRGVAINSLRLLNLCGARQVVKEIQKIYVFISIAN